MNAINFTNSHLSLILQYLDVPSLGVMGKLNKKFNDLVFKNTRYLDFIWKHNFTKDYIPGPILKLEKNERVAAILKFKSEEKVFFEQLNEKKIDIVLENWHDDFRKSSFCTWFSEAELEIIESFNNELSNCDDVPRIELLDKHPFLMRFSILTKIFPLFVLIGERNGYFRDKTIDENVKFVLNAVNLTNSQIKKEIKSEIERMPWSCFGEISPCLLLVFKHLSSSHQKELFNWMVKSYSQDYKNNGNTADDVNPLFKEVERALYTFEPDR